MKLSGHHEESEKEHDLFIAEKRGVGDSEDSFSEHHHEMQNDHNKKPRCHSEKQRPKRYLLSSQRSRKYNATTERSRCNFSTYAFSNCS